MLPFDEIWSVNSARHVVAVLRYGPGEKGRLTCASVRRSPCAHGPSRNISISVFGIFLKKFMQNFFKKVLYKLHFKF